MKPQNGVNVCATTLLEFDSLEEVYHNIGLEQGASLIVVYVENHIEDSMGVNCTRNWVVVEQFDALHGIQFFHSSSHPFATYSQALKRFDESVPVSFRGREREKCVRLPD
ncbi:hypothetical protein MRX96_056154 [Rhipicephalus microplus]